MISKTAEYALRAVVCLAGLPETPLSAEALATRTRVPRSYLHRVLQELGGAGLVHSRPGPGGGYELSRPINEVTLLDVVNAVAPVERIRFCPLGLPSHTQLCPLHKQLDEVYAATESALRRVSLANLLESTSSVVPLCDVPLTGLPNRNQLRPPG